MDSLPLAIPYPWGDSDEQASRILTRKRQGAGINYVQNKRHRTVAAKRILEDLLGVSSPETQDTSHLSSSSFFVFGATPAVANACDDVQQLAQDGNVSLLLTILTYIEQHGGEDGVSTTDLIRSCALAVYPASTPGSCNAKDMVVAALLFLSATHAPLGDDVSILPLIQADNPHDEMDRRVYRRVGSHYSMDSLAELQLLFDSSPIARDKFVPLRMGDESEMLTTGNPPAHAMPKRKGPAPGYRRKTPTAEAADAAE